MSLETSDESYSSNPNHHLRDELARTALLVKAFLLHVKSTMTTDAGRPDRTSLPAECETILREEFRWDNSSGEQGFNHEHADCLAEVVRQDSRIASRLRRTRDEIRTRLPIWDLARRFRLLPSVLSVSRNDPNRDVVNGTAARDSLALDVLILALLVDRFPTYRDAILAAEGHDSGSNGLRAETILRILQPTSSTAELRWSVLEPTAPLLAHELVAHNSASTRGQMRIGIDPRVASFLVGEKPGRESSLGDSVSVTHFWRNWERVRLDPDVLDQLRRLSHWWWSRKDEATLLVLLHGAWGTPFAEVVQAFVTQPSHSGNGKAVKALPVVEVDVATSPTSDWAGFVRRVYREATLRHAVVLWNRAELLLSDGTGTERRETLLRRAEQTAIPTFLASPFAWDPAGAFLQPQKFFVRIELPVPSPAVRREMWKHRLRRDSNRIAEDSTPADKLALDLLESFDFTQGEVDAAVAAARGLALIAPPVEENHRAAQGADILAEACRRQAARRPVSFARRVSPHPLAEDVAANPRDVLRRRVILPAARHQQLAELLDRMTYVSRVHHDLGFEQRMNLGRGVVALFSGPPGTGKTLAATTLASVLRKDLHKVDAAAVASRFVGETEKNLARVFADVQGANAVLFFDEADALFGRRGEVVQAADRWANLQISYLLERIEEYTGTVILATNSRETVDHAFFRRVQVLIEFPRPDAASRLAILEGMLTGSGLVVADANGQAVGTPEAARAVLRPVAERFELTGGNLKNVVVDAAFRAAACGVLVVTFRELLLGVAREYQKEGKPVSVASFGKEWFAIIEKDLQLGR